ncbi:MAG: glycosyltransferase family 4 protein [Candidatus Promineifilaceae bacterium]|nr:glycosyltransferase family 4 protein [Candidatus Promineifilaceae bacterium]
MAGALAAHGHQIEFIQLFPRAAQWREGDISFRFIPPSIGARSLARVAGRLTGREWARAVLALPALHTARSLQPDVIHFHGLVLTLNLLALWVVLRLPALPGRAAPVVGHYHGGFPSSNPLWRRLQALALRRLDLALFSTRAHARPFVEAGQLSWNQVGELMEVSSHFRLRPRAAARAITGMGGAPVFLWVGRLHPVKDPLTAVRGFAHIHSVWPEAQLYLHYLTDELLPALRSFVAERPQLANHVHFRGTVAHERMEAVFNSADFLLQASRREYSGYAVLEAMACGVIPVVTDIPSFRKMTADGRYGILFPPGKAETLARRVLDFDREQIPISAAAVHHHFVQELSYEALARRLLSFYHEAVAGQRPGPHDPMDLLP